MTKSIRRELKTQALILGGFVAIFWILEIVDQFFLAGSLNQFGIRPRSSTGLVGIFFAPFLHGNFPHLIANTIPFVILGWFTMLQETRDFFLVTAITMIVGGLGVWFFGQANSIHIGASILIFGYLGFLLFRGYFQRNFPSIAVSILVFILYGGLVWGVLPGMPGISWQGHLFGFIGGAIAARLLK